MPRIAKTDEPSGVSARAPLGRSDRGSSGSFLVRADDGRRYWCKVLNNLQSSRVPVTEQIVGRLGALLGVAVCEVKLVRITADLVGWEFRDGHQLEEGWAHGAVAVTPVVEVNSLDHRAADENAVRHAGFYALHDWLCGSDLQWLRCSVEENAYYSHDHGHYLQGPGWTADSLRAVVGNPFPLGCPPGGLNRSELHRLADRLEASTEEELVDAASNIPTSWPVTEEELEAVVEFALARGPAVAARLRGMITQA